MRKEVEALFTIFSLFPEDAVVPVAAIDVVLRLLLPELSQNGATSAKQKLQVRRWLQQLLKASLLRGSIDGGVAVHDLVRNCMIRRLDEAREGGLRAAQRDAVPLLVHTFEKSGPAASYAAASLQWHIRHALQQDVALPEDELIWQLLVHESPVINRQVSLGIGLDELHITADRCD